MVLQGVVCHGKNFQSWHNELRRQESRNKLPRRAQVKSVSTCCRIQTFKIDPYCERHSCKLRVALYCLRARNTPKPPKPAPNAIEVALKRRAAVEPYLRRMCRDSIHRPARVAELPIKRHPNSKTRGA